MTKAFTITAKNYLALALNLGDSLKATNPDLGFTIFLVEEDLTGIQDSDRNRFTIVPASELRIADYEAMKFRYDVIELNTAIKPSCFSYLKQQSPTDQVIYLDPDIQVYGSLHGVVAALGEKLVAVTPHYLSLQSPWQGAVPEANFLISGVFNLGFLALNTRHAECDAVLEWWGQRLKDQCHLDRMDGLFYDQNWIMVLAATHATSFVVLRDPGLNCAWWNLHERSFRDQAGRVEVACGGEFAPLTFFHFSGYKIGDGEAMNRRYAANPLLQLSHYERGPVQSLFLDYSRAVADRNHAHYSRLAYQYERFSDGSPVLRLHRRLLRVYQETTPRRVDHYQAELRTAFRSLPLSGRNYFDSEGDFAGLLKKNRLMVKENVIDSVNPDKDSEKFGGLQRLVTQLLRLGKALIGTKNYLLLMRFLGYYAREEYMLYLLKLGRRPAKG